MGPQNPATEGENVSNMLEDLGNFYSHNNSVVISKYSKETKETNFEKKKWELILKFRTKQFKAKSSFFHFNLFWTLFWE